MGNFILGHARAESAKDRRTVGNRREVKKKYVRQKKGIYEVNEREREKTRRRRIPPLRMRNFTDIFEEKREREIKREKEAK